MKQSKEQILQNLKDAGCTEEEIAAFMKELEAGKPGAVYWMTCTQNKKSWNALTISHTR